jgi:hypothetical protein
MHYYRFGIAPEGFTNTPYFDHEELNEEDLLKKVLKQEKKFHNKIFVYWNHRPLTHDKWVKMLRKVFLYVKEVHSLEEFEQFSTYNKPKTTQFRDLTSFI